MTENLNPFSVKLHSSANPIAWRMGNNDAENYRAWLQANQQANPGVTQNAIIRAAISLLLDNPDFSQATIERAKRISQPNKSTRSSQRS